jgi:hypothetical protein
MDLFEIFRTARYNVEGLGDLYIGEPLPKSVVQWMRVNGTNTFAMVGAENPQGVKATEPENQIKHLELLNYCMEKGFTFLAATGSGEDWHERGVAIIGISREGAMELMHMYDQAAILYAEIDGVVEMISQ